MVIEVLSREDAEKRASFVGEKTGIVSITSPSDEIPSFSGNNNIVGVFRMVFDDSSEEKRSSVSPRKNEFDGLRAFADRMCDEGVKILIVHCGAGISRSAGAACAIAEYLNIEDTVFGRQDLVPNHLVYQLAAKELGIAGGSAYEKQFADWEKRIKKENPAYPEDPGRTVRAIMKGVDKRWTVSKIAKKTNVSEELAEKIVRLYLTHPGVDAEGIMRKMGL